MKKKLLIIALCFVLAIVLTGCSSKSKDKQLIIDTKGEVEKVSTQIFDNNKNISSILGNTKQINSEDYEASFLSIGYDMFNNLEKQYNNGTKIYIKYSSGEENGMVIGEDKNDNTKYHIYIGSETYKELWSYATIDLNTGDISWQDNY